MNKHDWLKKATDPNGDRPALQRVHYEEGLAIATDGFNLHVTTADRYPDWRNVTEKIDPDNGIYIAVDARKLIKAIEGMDSITLHISGSMEPIEISGNSFGGDPFYAVVMPMRIGGRDDDPQDGFWRPKGKSEPTPTPAEEA